MYKWPISILKFVYIISHEGNANYNQSECYFIPIKITILNKTDNSTSWQEYREREISYIEAVCDTATSKSILNFLSLA